MSSQQEIQATDGYAMSGPVQSIVSANEYEVSTLCEDNSTLPLELGEDAIPPMHMLQEVTSEDDEEDDDAMSSDDNEKYKIVDDTSEDYTPGVSELAAADSDEGHDSDSNSKKMDDKGMPPLVHLLALNKQKKFTFHEYTQSDTKNLVVKRVDEPSGPVTCKWENCNRTFDTPELLAKHIDFEHDLSSWICRWVPCTRYFKPFDARYKLLVHLRCHTGEKPYKCTIPGCTRKFSRIENMKLHVRTHTGEKPYVCGYEGCTKRFNNSSDRAKHAKTHVSTKPYKCKFPGCEKYYTDPSSMRKHYRSTHFDKGQPKSLPTNVINTNITASNVTGLTMANCVIPGSQGTQPDAQVSVANTNTNNNSLFQVPVPVFQLPSSSDSGGGPNGDMLHLIQQGKMQPILLQNGTQQPMLMFVPTVTVQQGTTATVQQGAQQLPTLLPVQQQQQQQQQQHLIISSVQPDKSANHTKTNGGPEQQVKNVRVIVSSGKVNREHTVNKTSSNPTTTTQSHYRSSSPLISADDSHPVNISQPATIVIQTLS